jgi:hypothetical protein
MHWFTLETGLAIEDGRPKAYGAAILSSPQEMEHVSPAPRFAPSTSRPSAVPPSSPRCSRTSSSSRRASTTMIATVSAWLDTL